MLRRTISMLSVVLAAFGIVAAFATPASAATTRLFSVVGNTHISDYETFAANEHCYSSLNTTRQLNTNNPLGIEWIRYCGGEIRAELYMEVERQENNYLSIIGEVQFFEGTSTGTGDLDGEKSFTLYIKPGTSTLLNLHVWNRAEGEADDYVNYALRVGNYNP